MHTIARGLQMLGLAVPPLAMMLQLQERITAGQMLQFLVASILLFSVGYLLQRIS